MPITSRTEEGRRWAALFSILLVAAFLAHPAARAAETETFGFQPHPNEIAGETRRGFRLAIAPGAAVRDSVLAFNKTDETLELRIYGADTQRDQAGTVSVAPFGAASRGVGSWIRIDEPEVTLGPREQAVIDFSVARPEDADDATGAIVAEELPEEDSDGGLQLVTRVALLVEVGTGSDAPHIALSDAELIIPAALVPRQGDVQVLVTNRTARRFEGSVAASVRSLTGRTYDLLPKDVDLPPGGQQVVEIAWSSVPAWGGIMRAETSLEWEGGLAQAKSARKVIFPIWLIIALMTITAGGWAVWLRRQPDTP